jgi:hypothetical protein
MSTTTTRIKLRRKSASAWATSNEILLDGEMGIETDSKPVRFKFGDGVTPWNSLPYSAILDQLVTLGTNGNFTVQDAEKNIGLILTSAGILKISALEAATIKINGQNISLPDLATKTDISGFALSADFNLSKAKTDQITIDTNGNLIIADALKNIGLMLTKAGVLQISALQAAAIKLNGQDLILSDFAKAADVNPLTSNIRVDSAGNVIFSDSNGYVGFKLSAAGLITAYRMALQQMQVGATLLSDDPNWLLAIQDSNKNLGFGFRKDGYLIVKGIKAANLEVSGTATIPGLSTAKYQNSLWKGKNIWWCGTSIPAGNMDPVHMYPNIGAAQHAVANCFNVALATSPIRISKQDGTIAGVEWYYVAYGLTHTLAEKENLITNWATIGPTLAGSPPATLSASQQTLIRNASYEMRLKPYLDGTNPLPDLFVIDHGYNDRGGYFSLETASAFQSVPTNRVNRGYYIGAVNYLIDYILSYQPRARIAFFGHYENVKFPEIAQAQQAAASGWSYYIFPTWNRLGWNYVQKAPGSKTSWAVAPYSTYSSGQDTSQDMTLYQLALPDRLHPFTDTSAKSSNQLANLAGEFLFIVK